MDTRQPPASPSAHATSAFLQNTPINIPILLTLTVLPLLLFYTLHRPSLPKSSPPIHPTKAPLPIIGHPQFFTSRTPFILSGLRAVLGNAFSFYFGPLHIVAVSGVAGRRAFFESKDLSFSEGYNVLFANTPNGSTAKEAEKNGDSFNRWFKRELIFLMRTESLEKRLSFVFKDTQSALDEIAARNGNSAEGLMDPFDDIYRLVYQITMRTVGATEIAESKELCAQTLKYFEAIDQNPSPARIVFPWLPTLNQVRRTVAGGKLFMVLRKIVEARRKEGRREEDALQHLLDTGNTDLTQLLKFIIGALFAGQLNSGVSSGWLLVYLGANREWYDKVQAEVDAAIAKYRTSPSQSRTDVLSTLSLEAWESSFQLIDICLRETLRLVLVGCAFRKNSSDKPVHIGGADSGEVIPQGAFTVYLLDDIHMNPDIYPDPYRFDPGRYFPSREEDKKEHLGFLGWGAGRHVCLGMKFAKLEMQIIIAFWMAQFEFDTVDVKGQKRDAPRTNRAYHQVTRPDEDVRLKYRKRAE